MGLNVSSQHGGAEAGTVVFSLAMTEISRACASTAVTMSVTNMVGEVIQSVASEAQKQKYLPKLCSGEYAAGGFCLTESGAGSDPSGMKTKAVLEGDEWVINGAKQFISSAEYAGVFVLWAVTDPSAPKGKGISCFLVEADAPGLVISPAEKKMGQHASATNEVVFNDCRLPKDALMGTLNQGFKVAVSELAGGRIGVGSQSLGIGLAAIDYAREYVNERQQFGKEASMAKLFASEKANQVCYTALQLMGGAGYIKDYPLERYARDVRVATIYEGTSEIQRVIIARELLREIN